MTALAVVAAVAAWMGAATLVLSEGRRGLAAGTALYAIGLGGATAQPVPALLVVVAGLAAAALRLRDGTPGWSVLPPGSTPRLLLAIVVGVAGAFAATSLLPGPGTAPARAAIVLGGIMAAARLLSTERRQPALAAVSLLCLVMAGLAALVSAAAWPAVTAAAAAAAVLTALLPAREETGVG